MRREGLGQCSVTGGSPEQNLTSLSAWLAEGDGGRSVVVMPELWQTNSVAMFPASSFDREGGGATPASLGRKGTAREQVDAGRAVQRGWRLLPIGLVKVSLRAGVRHARWAN